MERIYLGPLFSEGGCRTWDCWLSPRSIIAVRHKLWRRLRVTSWQYLGFPEDPHHPPLAHEPQDRVYLIEQLQAITVTHKTLSHNEMLFTLSDGKLDLYGIFDRKRTNEYRGKLSSCYPTIYQDVGFCSAPIPTGV